MNGCITIRRAQPLEWRSVYSIIRASWVHHYRAFMSVGVLLPGAGHSLQRVIRERTDRRSKEG